MVTNTYMAEHTMRHQFHFSVSTPTPPLFVPPTHFAQSLQAASEVGRWMYSQTSM